MGVDSKRHYDDIAARLPTCETLLVVSSFPFRAKLILVVL